jgi:hypothetical protein
MIHRLSVTNSYRRRHFPQDFHDFHDSCSSTTSNNNSSLSRAPQQSQVADINSPLIQEDGDNKVLKLRFDVSQYTPEEIVVKTVDNKLMVSVLFPTEKFPSNFPVYFRFMPNTRRKQTQRASTENTTVNFCCPRTSTPNQFARPSVKTVS